MNSRDNYAITADYARRRFTTYDLSKIISKTPLEHDADFLYLRVLDRTCRIGKTTGQVAWSAPDGWEETAQFHDLLTIFDYLCDGKAGRRPSGQMKAMASFGQGIHTGLLESEERDELAEFIDLHPEKFRKVCLQQGGIPFAKGDLAYTLQFFPDLQVTVQFWHSDEDFPPQLRWLWDAAALDFIRYETLFYAVRILRQRLIFWLGSCR